MSLQPFLITHHSLSSHLPITPSPSTLSTTPPLFYLHLHLPIPFHLLDHFPHLLYHQPLCSNRFLLRLQCFLQDANCLCIGAHYIFVESSQGR
jgi:hypothetical protein